MGYSKIVISEISVVKECPFCGHKYICYEEEQIPGFKDWEEEVCPHCDHVIRTSMEYEFRTYKI